MYMCVHAYVHGLCMNHMSGTFDSYFNLAVWQIFFNHQTKVTAHSFFVVKYLWQSLAIPHQTNVRKLSNLACTIPTVHECVYVSMHVSMHVSVCTCVYGMYGILPMQNMSE